MTDLRQAAQQALEALEDERYVTKYTHIVEAITALQTELAQPEQEPTQWRDMVVVSLVREGINKHKARELADHFATPLAAAQPEQEPVAYDKTEINCFVQSLYDEKMQEGKHGHYETMFHVVHQAIKKVAPPKQQAEPVAQSDLVKRLRDTASKGVSVWGDLQMEAAREIEILTAERESYASAMDRMLEAQPEQRKPLTDDVLVPLEILEAAANSLDSFCGNLGWGDADLQTLDNLFAVIEQHKAAHNIKEGT